MTIPHRLPEQDCCFSEFFGCDAIADVATVAAAVAIAPVRSCRRDICLSAIKLP
ncbi:hypothetical protein JCM19241_1402 [Vibrio ishigakensis]|uniref:Uncharacterized protein n=1 Tax=Vibrio ishigakensis TaxID=1481914 RepID=A0A0B8QKN7_9VIBR|nr:hypothetical protein JCM19241_1402 [Vibrio ishigakensis]